MTRGIRLFLVVGFLLLAFPFRSPAPLIYRPGEGWTYEPVGGGPSGREPGPRTNWKWRKRPLTRKTIDWLSSWRRVVRVWPLSDYAPQGQYLVGRCFEETGQDEKAFKEYQRVLEKQPKISNYEEILQRQVANYGSLFGGKMVPAMGLHSFLPSMERTADMYEKIVKNGPYSEVAPQAQLKVGAAREKAAQLSACRQSV